MSTPQSFIAASRDAAPFKRKRVDKLTLGDATLNVHYFEKEIIPIGVGSRRHPDLGYPIDVPPERADHWIQTFGLMQERGQRIPGPPDHSDRKDSYGQWVALSRRPNGRGGESLYGELMVKGDATAEKVLNIGDVSIRTVRELKDDLGNVYADAVEHISVTPFPAVTGLSTFVPIAASRGPAGGEPEPEQVPVFDFSLSTAPEEPAMDLKVLRTALGAADTVPDADVIAQAAARVTGIPAAVEAAKQTAIAASRTKPADPDLLNGWAELTLARIDQMKVKGMPDLVANRLKALVKTGEQPNEFMLSRQDAIAARPVDAMLDVLKDVEFATGLKHGSQLEAAARPAQPANPLDLARGGPTADDLAKEKAEAEAWRAKELEARGHAPAPAPAKA